MKIKYLGSGASEGFPAMFCTCDNCKRAKLAGGKNIRTRSQTLINDDLLLDFNQDTYAHVVYGGLDLLPVKNIFITHYHEDHLCGHEFINLRPPFAVEAENMVKPDVFASKATIDFLQKDLDYALVTDEFITVHTLTPFEKVKAGNYDVTPLTANHDPKTEPLIYIVSDGEKSILYAHDTGWFTKETWDFLKENKPYFSLVSLDCTCTCDKISKPDGHMNLISCDNARNELIKMGCADENTSFVLNHFSHNGGYTYDELVPVAAEMNFTVTYDGIEIDC
ncbi:MAG: MBL fold metallo-hydrolase [Clostridia bacterium]|nr:MBL fold metallo-hydrolase [Clostridia bacterium]